MYSWKTYLPGLLAWAPLIPFVCCSLPARPSEARSASPRQMEDVIKIAQNLGLHYRGDREDGQVQIRLLISASPLTWERANTLVVGRRVGSDWVGTVAVIQGLRAFPLVSHDMTVWGEFLIYGDPALIKKLTGQADPDRTGAEASAG